MTVAVAVASPPASKRSLQRVFLDFESHYSDEFLLKKMTPIEYVLDPRFEALGCAFIWEGGASEWVDGPDLPAYLARIDWSGVFAISHNATFDMLVLALRYNVFPRFYGCTLSMARNWLSHRMTKVGLAEVAKHYGMSPKGTTLTRTKGIGFEQLRQMPELYAEVKDYALDDAAKCRDIFHRIMMDGFPPHELLTVDMVVRMAAQPQFENDPAVLSFHRDGVIADKRALLDAAELSDADIAALRSDAQLAALLARHGVIVPRKKSKKTGAMTYAFAKTDRNLTALLDHKNPKVRAIVAARLAYKSTIEESRAERMMAVAGHTSSMPVPLKYSGAHTHRFSGDWKINLQNLPRGGELRKALRAPKGKVVVAVDASQIEARINAMLSGEKKLIKAFRQKGRDVYAEFAEQIYRRPIDKEKDKKNERFVGKTAVLSLGYGSSWRVFQNMCRVKGGVHLSDHEAKNIVSLYQQTFSCIVDNWRVAEQRILPALKNGHRLKWGPIVVEREALLLPNGNRLHYRNLRREWFDGRLQWRFERGRKTETIYGAKLVENVCQALAFTQIMEAALRVRELSERELGQELLLPVHQVHDELVYVVDKKLAERVKELAEQEMSRSPTWMPDVPLAADGGKPGPTYGDCK